MQFQVPPSGLEEVDEMFVVGQDEGFKGRKKVKKKLAVVAIEKKSKCVSCFYAKVIEKADAKSLGGFMRENIGSKAHITTDEWAGYKPFGKEFEYINHVKSGKKG